MFNKLIRLLIPYKIYSTIRSYKILSFDFGQYRTMRKWECIDRSGDPIPWFSYPAIEYIRQFDFTDKTVFEYGSGNSTIFWSKRCQRLISIEDDMEWYKKTKPHLPGEVDYLLLREKEEYIRSILNYSDNFDIIIIDGSHRFECALMAVTKLKNNGMIILDNSDWYKKTTAMLRGEDLIEVDMSGFGPINGYTTTTSFFFSRGISLKPAHDRQPIPGIGSIPNNED